MAEKPKKPKKPKPDGEAKPRKGGGGGGLWRWGLWLLALVLVYAVSVVPLRWMNKHDWIPGAAKPWIFSIYKPIEWAYEHSETVRRAYDWGFSAVGVR